MTKHNVKLNVPTGDEVKTTPCYMGACRSGIRVLAIDGGDWGSLVSPRGRTRAGARDAWKLNQDAPERAA